jgi:predicted nuclease of predicted toxin-antitoxin system
MMEQSGGLRGRARLIIVSKDADFHRRSFLLESPPKVIRIRTGNCRTTDIEALLRDQVEAVRSFVDDEEAAFLALG